jgi:vacuolar-type H+-ATPase subunit H
MKNNKRNPHPGTEQAIQQVLQAERDAEQAIKDCEQEARQIIYDARNRSQRIYAHTDQRITNMEMRHGHKLDRTIKNIEREGAVELRLDAGQQCDPDSLHKVIENLAVELCQLNSAAED